MTCLVPFAWRAARRGFGSLTKIFTEWNSTMDKHKELEEMQ